MAQHYAKCFTLPHFRVGSNYFPVLQMRKLRHINLSHITPLVSGRARLQTLIVQLLHLAQLLL